MPELRVFLASRRSSGESEIAQMKKMATAAFAQKLPPEVPVVLTTSDQCHLDNFSRMGGWAQWIEYVVSGVRYADREVVYNAYLLYETDLGRANANIFRRALQAGKMCLYMEPTTGEMSFVDRIIEVDPNNWINGWAAELR